MQGNGDALKMMGQRILSARKLRGLTREQLAERIERSVSFLCQIERGERTLSMDTFLRMMHGLQLPAGYFIPSIDENTDLKDARLIQMLELLRGCSSTQLEHMIKITETMLPIIK